MRCWRCKNNGDERPFEIGMIGVCKIHQLLRDISDFNRNGLHPAPVRIGSRMFWTALPYTTVKGIPFYVKREVLDSIELELKDKECSNCGKTRLKPDDAVFYIPFYYRQGDKILVLAIDLSICEECGMTEEEYSYYFRLSLSEAKNLSTCPICNKFVGQRQRHVVVKLETGTIGRWHYNCYFDVQQALMDRLKNVEFEEIYFDGED